jgi:hypothetical protein
MVKLQQFGSLEGEGVKCHILNIRDQSANALIVQEDKSISSLFF